MPRPPHLSPAVASIRGAVYSALGHKLAAYQGERYPFHVGDTYLPPPDGCRLEDLRQDDDPSLNRYTPPHGDARLLDSLVETHRSRTGDPVERAHLLVTGGATAGLANCVTALVSPGEEVLVLAPHWPLIDGIVRMVGATPVPVPFIGRFDTPEGAVDAVRPFLTHRTAALYFNTPNNPTGTVLPRPVVEAVVSWAAREGLWVLSDEVYERTVFDGEHVYARPLAPERTLSVHSFSKGFGMAGYRVGYVAGPREAMGELRKAHTHTVYSAGTAAQLAVARALAGPGEEWAARARSAYADVGRKAAARLGLGAPGGSTFLFVDVARSLRGRDLGAFLSDCADRGLFLAPGPSFGPYPTHVRLCFTAAPPDVTLRGVEVLAGLL